MDAFDRFTSWVRLLGGPTAAAELLRCDVGHVSHITRRRRRPGVDLAVAIEERTKRLVGGAIRVADWSGVRADRRVQRDERAQAGRKRCAKTRRRGLAEASGPAT